MPLTLNNKEEGRRASVKMHQKFKTIHITCPGQFLLSLSQHVSLIMHGSRGGQVRVRIPHPFGKFYLIHIVKLSKICLKPPDKQSSLRPPPHPPSWKKIRIYAFFLYNIQILSGLFSHKNFN